MAARSHPCSQAKNIRDLQVELAKVKGTLGNGLSTRVKWIERMQWWQLGILVAIIGGLIGGMWYFTTRTMDADRELLNNVRVIIEQHNASGQRLPGVP